MKLAQILWRVVCIVIFPTAVALFGIRIALNGEIWLPSARGSFVLYRGVSAGLVGMAFCFAGAYLHLLAAEFTTGRRHSMIGRPSLLLWITCILLAIAVVSLFVPFEF